MNRAAEKSRRVVITRRGGPEVLQLETRKAPLPRRGQVRVRVTRAGVAFGDVVRRMGVLAPPWSFTPGYDVVGVIDRLGRAVRGLELGTRVAVLMPGPGLGGYSDHVTATPDQLVLIPDGVSDNTAIALGLNYVTAYQLIHRVTRLAPGQSALVHGAAGGLGTALLDLGRLHGLRLFGTASLGKHEHLRERGSEPIDYRNQDFVERIRCLTTDGVDAVFDGIGGSHLRRSYATLGPGGTLVALGISGDLETGALKMAGGLFKYLALKANFEGKRLRMYAITASPGASRSNCRSDWAKLLDLAEKGDLKPAIGAVVPLAEARAAHRLMDERATVGKIVLDCEVGTSRP